MTMEAINLVHRVDEITGHWQPEHLMTVDSSHTLKLAKIQGSFIWHCHPATDEVFYCVSGGPMRLELSTKATSPEHAEELGADQTVELSIGDIFKVPRGVQHRPIANVETGIMMIEKVGTVNTGDREGHELTTELKGSEE
jgi:mannose-6-phosphate isomerase-like protein (cupin superfamily)